MRIEIITALFVGSAGVVAAVSAAGCESLRDCATGIEIQEAAARGERISGFRCREDPAGGGGNGGTNPACIPSASNALEDDTCGVFVRLAGDDNNPGTKTRPVRTLAKALEVASKSLGRVYMCAEEFEEPTGATVPASILAIYGGLDCAGSSWTLQDEEAKTKVTAPPDQVPLRLESKEAKDATELHNLHVFAKSATVPGGSSIAVIAEGAMATFVHSKLETGNGADGLPGESYTEAASDGQNGEAPKVEACLAETVAGGTAPENECSEGGQGGPGGGLQGFPGGSGTPAGDTNGGLGEQSSACTPGKDGDNGTEGKPGSDALGPGTLDPKDGYTGAPGADGNPGTPGRGGGGGGGAKSALWDENQCEDVFAGSNYTSGGAAGGSGASGGCGGQGGRGGGAGGASIAVVSITSTLTFDAPQFLLGNGGQPGTGSDGQEGGVGGSLGGAGGKAPAGSKLNNGCKGGRGGNGGRGGRGADGLGGHVIAVAYTITEPEFRHMFDETAFTYGEPGLHGGVKAKKQAF